MRLCNDVIQELLIFNIFLQINFFLLSGIIIVCICLKLVSLLRVSEVSQYEKYTNIFKSEFVSIYFLYLKFQLIMQFLCAFYSRSGRPGRDAREGF